MSSRTNRKQKRTSNRSWGMVNVGLTILYAILALILLFTMFNYNFLSFRFLNIIITIGLLVVLAISIFLQKTKKSPLVTTVVLVIFSLVSLVGIFGFKQMIDITNRMNQTAAFSEVEMSIVVPKDSDIKDVSQLTSVQAPTKVDKNNIDTLMSALKKDKKVDVKVDDVASYQEAYDALQEANISMGLITDIVNSTPEDYGISIAYRSVMGVEIPKIAYDKQPLKMTYDIERSNSKVDYAYNCFYNVKQLTVLLAEVENSVYRLANTIRKTQKRANALRNISIPRFESTIKVISEALEEKEREEFTRQKVIKEMKK